MEQRKLKRGDVVRRSISGAKGFYYPDFNGRAIMVRGDCVAERQVGWNTCSEFVAYSVPTEAFSEKDRYDKGSSKMIIWVAIDG